MENTKQVIDDNYITYLGQVAITNSLYKDKHISDEEFSLIRKYLKQKYQIRD